MTFDQAVTMVVQLLGNRQDLRSQVETWMEFVKDHTIEKNPQFMPWYLLPDADQSLTITANTSATALPTDFLKEYEYGFLWATVDGKLRQVTKKDLEWCRARYPDTNTDGDPPLHYAAVGQMLYWFPRPVTVQTVLTAKYYTAGGRLTNTQATNLHLTHASDWLIYETAVQMGVTIESPRLEFFAAKAKQARQRVEAETYERHAINSDTRLGERP